MNSEWRVESLEAQLDGFHLGPVDLTLRPGRTVAVLGPSGAGKTTFLRTLAGFLPARGGRLPRDGTEITDWLPEDRELGYVPQGLGLFPHRTVAGNIGYPLEVRNRPDQAKRTQELLEQFRLVPLAKRHPARLSGGEQQRVAIARALAADPQLIIWDEPWQGLDVQARYELGLALHQLREIERVPMVVVTHDPTLAFSIADDFLVLGAGQVRAQCDASRLLCAPSDPFVARFIGFENVFDRPGLEDGGPGSLPEWLRQRAGSAGIAFASPPFPPGPGAGPTWEGTVRSARPGPQGLTVEAVADGLLVTLRMPPPVAPPLPGLGSRVRFAIEPGSLHALGTPSGRREGP